MYNVPVVRNHCVNKHYLLRYFSPSVRRSVYITTSQRHLTTAYQSFNKYQNSITNVALQLYSDRTTNYKERRHTFVWHTHISGKFTSCNIICDFSTTQHFTIGTNNVFHTFFNTRVTFGPWYIVLMAVMTLFDTKSIIFNMNDS